MLMENLLLIRTNASTAEDAKRSVLMMPLPIKNALRTCLRCKAIESDEQGRASINQDKCVSCGMCMVSCPFGAISDKSQIFQLHMLSVRELRSLQKLHQLTSISSVKMLLPANSALL